MQLQKYHLKTAAQIPQWCCVTASGELANSGTPAHENHVVGVTDGLIESGAWGDVTVSGLLYNLGWSWTPGAALYLNGTALSQTPPGVGFTQQIGWALTGQSMIVDVQATGVGGTGPPGPAGPAGPAGPSSITNGFLEFDSAGANFSTINNTYADVVFGVAAMETTVLAAGTYLVRAFSTAYLATDDVVKIKLYNTEASVDLPGTEKLINLSLVLTSAYIPVGTEGKVTITSSGTVKMLGATGTASCNIRCVGASLSWIKLS